MFRISPDSKIAIHFSSSVVSNYLTNGKTHLQELHISYVVSACFMFTQKSTTEVPLIIIQIV